VQAAAAAAAARQRHVQRLLREARLEFFQFQFVSAGIKRRFDALLGGVDALAEGFLFVRPEGTELLQQRSKFSGLAEEFRLRILERSRVCGAGELRKGTTNYFFGIVQCARLALI